MEVQQRNWTCSICATDWTLRATALNPHSCREQVASEIGYPGCVDAYSGCKDINCIADVFTLYGVDSKVERVDFDHAYAICSSTAGVIDSLGMYHFMAIRGVAHSGQLWVANSAPGYCGVGDTISRSQFNALGPWQILYLIR